MKTKQIVGILVAGLTFVIVCLSSALTKSLFKDSTQNTWKSFFEELENESEFDLPDEDYVGVVKVEGSMSDGGTSSENLIDGQYCHRGLLNLVDSYMEDDNNKSILLYVNSPGGTVNAADELYLKLMEYKNETKRPIFVYMADEACSGGYYVSVTGDKIFANRNTWTGSIGVYMELGNYKALFDKLGIKTTYIKAGKNKTMGSATQDLTPEQQQILQSLVDESYEQFVSVIATGRKNMTEDQIRVAADGRIYSSAQAKKVGLIDDIKTYDEVIDFVKAEHGGKIKIHEEEGSSGALFDLLYSKLEAIGTKKEDAKSDEERILEHIEKYGSGVPMYYAMH